MVTTPHILEGVMGSLPLSKPTQRGFFPMAPDRWGEAAAMPRRGMSPFLGGLMWLNNVPPFRNWW